MSDMMRRLLIGGMIAMCALAARADEAVTLKDAPGRDIVEGYCSACHSLDYPRINAGFLDRKGWQSEVDKMIKAYGAPIGAGDAKTIVDYLSANYGSGE
jgi:sulfite dehydrogenase (cytochrome) subunit B